MSIGCYKQHSLSRSCFPWLLADLSCCVALLADPASSSTGSDIEFSAAPASLAASPLALAAAALLLAVAKLF
jgi:hypothetical protein